MSQGEVDDRSEADERCAKPSQVLLSGRWPTFFQLRERHRSGASAPDAVRCLLVGGLLAATKGDEHARSAGRQIEFYYLGLLFEKYSAQALKNSLLREHKALTDATYDTEWRRCLSIVQAKLQTLSVIQEDIIRNEK